MEYSVADRLAREALEGLPKAARRALDYTAASIGTILREGPPKDAEGFARLADELVLIQTACRVALSYGTRDPSPREVYQNQALRDIFAY